MGEGEPRWYHVGHGQLRNKDANGWTDQYQNIDDQDIDDQDIDKQDFDKQDFDKQDIDEVPGIDEVPAGRPPEPRSPRSPRYADEGWSVIAKRPRRRSSAVAVVVCAGVGVGAALYNADDVQGWASEAAFQAGQISAVIDPPAPPKPALPDLAKAEAPLAAKAKPAPLPAPAPHPAQLPRTEQAQQAQQAQHAQQPQQAQQAQQAPQPWAGTSAPTRPPSPPATSRDVSPGPSAGTARVKAARPAPGRRAFKKADYVSRAGQITVWVGYLHEDSGRELSMHTDLVALSQHFDSIRGMPAPPGVDPSWWAGTTAMLSRSSQQAADEWANGDHESAQVRMHVIVKKGNELVTRTNRAFGVHETQGKPAD
jgi:hypothetical protein